MSAGAIAGIAIGAAVGGMCILAAVLCLLSRFRRRKSGRDQSSRRESRRVELPTHHVDAKEAPIEFRSPTSPGSSMLKDGISPIETVLSKDEQEELHALRKRLQSMRSELVLMEDRKRAELDGGTDEMREMPA